MTIIIALRDNSHVYVGADSHVTRGYIVLPRPKHEAKIQHHQKAPMVIGCAGSTVLNNIARLFLKESKYVRPAHIPKDYLLNLVIKVIVPYFKKSLEDRGQLVKKDGAIDLRGELIIAYRNQVVTVHSSGAVIGISGKFVAIGSGTEVALGNLEATSGDAKKRVLKALKAASKYCTGVGEPFSISSA